MEFLFSLNFEWSFITGEKRFNWPMVFYFFGRYFALTTLIALLISLDVRKEVDCQALYTFLALGGVSCLGLASINLAIRTMIIWLMAPHIVIVLSLLILGQWSILLQGVVLKARWVPGTGCVVTQTNTNDQFIAFIYTMVLDFIVFILTAWKCTQPGYRQSRLYKVLFEQGIFYFAFVSIVNIPSVVMLHMDANPVFNILNNTSVFTLSTIAACRAVRHLSNFTVTKPAIYITFDGINTGDIVCRVPPTPGRELSDSQLTGSADMTSSTEMAQRNTYGPSLNANMTWPSHLATDPHQEIDLEAGQGYDTSLTATNHTDIALESRDKHLSSEANTSPFEGTTA